MTQISNIPAEAKQLQDWLVEIREHIHKNPEVGRTLPATADFVLQRLNEMGVEANAICESGIVANINGAKDGEQRTVLLRADMDALPVREQSGLPFASENGCMHACGHDMHASMLLGAARLIQMHRGDFAGTVRLVFQPDEEGFTGAKAMLSAGALGTPKPDAGLALHVHSGTPTDVVLAGSGTTMSGCTLFRITVHGKGCHGAMPETGVDPISIAAHIVLSIENINAREVSPLKPIVITFGSISGGHAPNVIPDSVILEGSIRAMDKQQQSDLLARISEIASGIAAAFKGSAETKELASAPPLINNPELVNTVTGYLKEILSENQVVCFEGGGMGSEDFASYTYEIPCAYLLLGAGSSEEDSAYGRPMHNEKVVFNEAVLSQGAMMLAYSALRLLS